jgi:hypothetical protein
MVAEDTRRKVETRKEGYYNIFLGEHIVLAIVAAE